MTAAAAAAIVALLVLVGLTVCASAAGRVWGEEEEGYDRTARREVTYDGRALILDGTRRMFFSGDIHYARSTPEVKHRCLDSCLVHVILH